MLIDAIDNGGINCGFGWLGKQDSFGSAGQMQFSRLAVAKAAAALQHQINAKIAPGQLLKRLIMQYLDAVAINCK